MPGNGTQTWPLRSRLLHVVSGADDMELEHREFILDIDAPYKFVMQVNTGDTDVADEDTVSFDEFEEKWQMLSNEERLRVLQVDCKEVFAKASQDVACVGCRRSIEYLCSEVMASALPTLHPLDISDDGVIALQGGKKPTAKACYPLFRHGRRKVSAVLDKMASRKSKRCHLHMIDSQRMLSHGNWLDVWLQLSSECRAEMTMFEAGFVTQALEAYLTKHRFCVDCKAKVHKACDILTGLCEGHLDDGYNEQLYANTNYCKSHCHINISTDTNYVARLISRATEDSVQGERHATTLEQAQKEVLTCLGEMLLRRLQVLWLRMRTVEESCRAVLQLTANCMYMSLHRMVENKRGGTALQELLDLEDAEVKKRKKKNKKKKNRKRAGSEGTCSECLEVGCCETHHDSAPMIEAEHASAHKPSTTSTCECHRAGVGFDEEAEERLLRSMGWQGAVSAEPMQQCAECMDVGSGLVEKLKQEREKLRKTLRKNFEQFAAQRAACQS